MLTLAATVAAERGTPALRERLEARVLTDADAEAAGRHLADLRLRQGAGALIGGRPPSGAAQRPRNDGRAVTGRRPRPCIVVTESDGPGSILASAIARRRRRRADAAGRGPRTGAGSRRHSTPNWHGCGTSHGWPSRAPARWTPCVGAPRGRRGPGTRRRGPASRRWVPSPPLRCAVTACPRRCAPAFRVRILCAGHDRRGGRVDARARGVLAAVQHRAGPTSPTRCVSLGPTSSRQWHTAPGPAGRRTCRGPGGTGRRPHRLRDLPLSVGRGEPRGTHARRHAGADGTADAGRQRRPDDLRGAGESRSARGPWRPRRGRLEAWRRPC